MLASRVASAFAGMTRWVTQTVELSANVTGSRSEELRAWFLAMTRDYRATLRATAAAVSRNYRGALRANVAVVTRN
jgi:hypothetical protein